MLKIKPKISKKKSRKNIKKNLNNCFFSSFLFPLFSSKKIFVLNTFLFSSNSIFLIFQEISLRPELASPPYLRIQGGYPDPDRGRTDEWMQGSTCV